MIGAALSRVKTWTLADYITLTESVALAAVVEVALRLVSMATILRTLERLDDGMSATPLKVEYVQRLARFASVPYRVLWSRAHCLRHSLVLCAMLRRRGLPARVCFGVDRVGVGLVGHAWVVIADSRLEEAPSRFFELQPAWSD